MPEGAQSREAVKRRYDLVLARERRHARAAALAIFEMENFSVWEVLLVPLLVMSYMRQRGKRDWFVRNYLYTKLMALEGALDLAQGDRTREEVDARVKAQTDKVFASDEAHVYGKPIQQAQLEEVRYLVDHDLRLLDARGEDYEALVRSAYPMRSDYRAHLEGLAEREQSVTDSALAVLGERGDPSLVKRMHEVFCTIRDQETDRIYGAR